jgi:hypothetical protein
MRTGSAVDDAVLQSRRLTIQHLRPIAWAHARDGVARYSGSGISEIDTGLSLEFAQSDANLRPTRGFTAGQVGIVPISPADQVTTPSTAQAVGDFTIAVLWWCSNTNGNVPDFIVRDSASGVYLLLTSVSGPAVRATVGSVLSNTIAISTGRPFVAVLTYLDGSQTGTLRCNGSSEIATDNGLSTDNVTIDLVVNTADEICYEAVAFDRALGNRECQLLEGVMAWNNGLPNALPGNHPFALRPPLIGD